MEEIFYLEDYYEPLNISYDTSNTFIVKPDKIRIRFEQYGATLEFDSSPIEANDFRIKMFSIGQTCLSVR